jgi:hypothetical protein
VSFVFVYTIRTVLLFEVGLCVFRCGVVSYFAVPLCRVFSLFLIPEVLSQLWIMAHIAVARQRPGISKYTTPVMSNGFANKHVCKGATLNSKRGMMFYVRSVPKCYK